MPTSALVSCNKSTTSSAVPNSWMNALTPLAKSSKLSATSFVQVSLVSGFDDRDPRRRVALRVEQPKIEPHP